MTESAYPSLFTPIKIRGVTLKNRIMSAPNMIAQTVGGRPTDFYIGYLEHKARGGAAIVNLGEASICDGASHQPPLRMIEENLSTFGEMSAAIHEHGALASVELTHGGMRANPAFNSVPIKGPSELVTDAGVRIEAMTRDDIERVATACADAAEYWLRAGFDAVHLHYGHTWLFTQFFSPLMNMRTDEFGGILENRMRFPLLALKRVRERVGNRMIISIRQSGSEFAEGGFTTEDVIEFLAQAQEYIDMVEVTTEIWERCMPTTYMPLGLNTGMSEQIKKSGRINIPIYVVGSILAPEQAEEIIASGKADGVAMARALIADPFFPLKARAGRSDEITPCLRCMNCTAEDNARKHFTCSVNPLIGREARLGYGDKLQPANNKRSVLVIGGGPAGMKAAVTAAERGHDVTLCEKAQALGGMLRFTDNDSLKHDLHRFKEYLVERVQNSNIRILLGREADEELISSLNPDHIIVAAGSKQLVPTYIKGFELARPATDIYFEPASVGDGDIVIIGGGLVGVEAALHLRNIGLSVTVLELDKMWGRDSGGGYRGGVMMKIDELALEIITEARCTEITDAGVKYEKDGKECFVSANSVFYSVGMESDESIYNTLSSKALFVDAVGDCKKVGKVAGAIHTGYFTALDIGVI